MKKKKPVQVNVDENFYRMMERARIEFKRKYGIKIKSQQAMTNLWSKNPSIFTNKTWIKYLKD